MHPAVGSAASLTALAVILAVVVNTVQAVLLFRLSRRRAARSGPPDAGPGRLFYVFVLPCLNEALVIGAGVRRLLELPSDNFAVLVVDDGSDDGTAEAVAAIDSDRVHILRRDLPHARQGKGNALNAALRHLRHSDITVGRDPADVIIAVLDADGRLQPNALAEIGPYFVADPTVGAIQIGVRMHNASASLLARMQDMEFVVYSEVFERGRHTFGAAGLGGNGQFVRLSALLSLGDEPWTDCLTEDLDLGLGLMVEGWRTGFCPRTYVSQQAVVSVRRLLRQRSRWFQGHLQCWRRLPALVRSPLPLRVVVDLSHGLTSPVLVLLTSIVTATSVAGLVDLGLEGRLTKVLSTYGLTTLLVAYILSCALTPLLAFVYWLRDRPTNAVSAILLAHLYLIYVYLWVPAGWWAIGRMVRGRRSWAKTARSVDSDAVPTTPAAVALAPEPALPIR